MKNKTLDLPALFFYGILCGALAIVFMVSFQHFENFYQPELLAQKYEQAKSVSKPHNYDGLNPKKVIFSYVYPGAKEVRLEGDFNAWGAYPLILNQGESDIEIFTLALALPEGKYKYYFVVDGQNMIDESAPKIISGDTKYNILEVK